MALRRLNAASIAHVVGHHSATHCHGQRRTFADLTPRIQIYRSTTRDPYINLAAEHHLLQRSHPDSFILFLYTNSPCVVIGRNQNPWLEVDFCMLRRGVPPDDETEETSGHLRPVALVRRRSGGGTVFHDEGNVNWSVICPSAVFTRATHAEMVVRALSALGVRGARVNDRHDIVQQQSSGGAYKISGSAYKLTRARSLHHGTCLLSSTNLSRIRPLLTSPAEPYIKARGVESVRSSVRNVGLENQEFEDAVLDEFRRTYAGEDEPVIASIGDEVLETPDVEKGFRELTSPEWIFGQTPQFTFSSRPTADDPRPRPSPPASLSPSFSASFTVRHGQIQDASLSGLRYFGRVTMPSRDWALGQGLNGQHLHRVTDWSETIQAVSPVSVDCGAAGAWLNGIFASKVH